MRLRILTRIWLIVGICAGIAVVPIFWLAEWALEYKALAAVVIILLISIVTRLLFRDVGEGLSALEVGLLNLKDGEYSNSLNYHNDDELGQLCALYNQTVDKLREDKHWIYQRELMLDKIIQSSPDVLFLINDQNQVIFSNISARHFFNMRSGIEGKQLEELFLHSPSGVKDAILSGREGLFSMVIGKDEPQTWHLSKGTFLLNNQTHYLFILKQMTRELSRQEVAVWKKVIRVISHELNNSLGPISSMLHSGRILSNKVNEDRLDRVFATIDDRIKHLTEFVQGYGKFAKIPEPKIQRIIVKDLFEQLARQWQFVLVNINAEFIYADPSQIEQLLINLLKNAHESGCLPEEVSIEISERDSSTIVEVNDKGPGIEESRLHSVLIPFYSTKSKGSGLGLALCREIIDAHHGSIALQNRESGGLSVRIILPMLS